MSDEKASEGWGFPLRSKKAHWFVNGISLCNAWMFCGALTNYQEGESPDDCAACKKKLVKRKGK